MSGVAPVVESRERLIADSLREGRVRLEREAHVRVDPQHVVRVEPQMDGEPLVDEPDKGRVERSKEIRTDSSCLDPGGSCPRMCGVALKICE